LQQGPLWPQAAVLEYSSERRDIAVRPSHQGCGLGKEIITRLGCRSASHRQIILHAVFLRGFWLSAHDNGHGDIRKPCPGACQRVSGPRLRRSVASRMITSAREASAAARDAGFCGRNLLEHEPEEREPVFRKDHAQTKG
jgi:hypothetical protein